MNDEERKLLEETARLAKENHKLLKSLHRKQTLATMWSSVKWVIIILITVWTWIALQPMIEQVQALYSQVQETSATVSELKAGAEGAFNTSGLQDVLNAFRMGSQ